MAEPFKPQAPRITVCESKGVKMHTGKRPFVCTGQAISIPSLPIHTQVESAITQYESALTQNGKGGREIRKPIISV